MKYTALIEIDDDRWAKHPFGITIYDEKGNVVKRCSNLDSRDECFEYSDKYGINRIEIKREYY